MGTFLFAAQPGMGHVNPLLTIASKLRASGHHASFVHHGPDSVKAAIEGHGFETVSVASHLSGIGLALLLPRLSGFLETWTAMHFFTSSSAHYARQLLPILRRVRPCAVVADFAFPGLYFAAESLGVPCATVFHAGLAYDGPGIPPFGSGLPIGGEWGWRGRLYRLLAGIQKRMILHSLGRTRASLGLPRDCPEPFWTSPWLTLVLTAQEVEAARNPLPDCTYYIGPCFAGRGGEEFPLETLACDRPRIYVSLGTVFNNKPHVFARIIEAFSDGACQLVVSAGGAYERLRAGRVPSNVLLFPRVPQVQVLEHVDVVVSHGGNNTVNESLAAGRPLVVLPVGGEQGDNASRVEYLGAGLRLDIARFSAAEIRRKVDRLLSEPSFVRRAQEVATVLGRLDGPGTAVRFLERLAATGEPVRRPAGYPQTVAGDAPGPWENGAGN